MALDRIEVRLSPGNPGERALIEALGDLGDAYGAKGRFLKERLLKGYAVVLGELDGLIRESDPMAALDRYATKVDPSHYRVLKALLMARAGGVEEAVFQRPRRAAPIAPASPPVVAASGERDVPAPGFALPPAPAPQPAPSTSGSDSSVVPSVEDALQEAASAEPSGEAADVAVAGQAPAAQDVVSATNADQDGKGLPGAAPVEAEGGQVEPPPLPKSYDWSSFRGIAGAKKGG